MIEPFKISHIPFSQRPLNDTPSSVMALAFQPKYQSALSRLCTRVRSIRASVGDEWPYHCIPGDAHWDTTNDGDWCGGHWVECLRIVGELENDSELLAEAEARTERLRPYLERDDQFRGHRFYYSAARQHAATHKAKYRTLALAAAYAVRSMAMERTGMMPIGTQVQVRSTTLSGRDLACIDNVHPNLILDWWAYKQTGDKPFAEGAKRMLDASVDAFINEDGSTLEFAKFDPVTGKKLRHFTILGKDDDSCWSRGHAWAVAGYLRAWEELGERNYLVIGHKLLKYWVEHCDESLVPPYDFKDPEKGIPRDTSAAAIVVEQLARLAIKPQTTEDPLAKEAAGYLEPMLDGLLKCLTPVDEEDKREPGILLEGCFNYPKRYAVNTETIWGTAYLLFTLYYLKTGRVVG